MSFAVPSLPNQGSTPSTSYATAPTPSASGVVSSVGISNAQPATNGETAEGTTTTEPGQVGVPEITAVQGIVPTLQ